MKIEEIIPNLMRLPRHHRVALARLLIKPDEDRGEKKLSTDDLIALAGVLLKVVEPRNHAAAEYNAMTGLGEDVLNPAWEFNIEVALREMENG